MSALFPDAKPAGSAKGAAPTLAFAPAPAAAPNEFQELLNKPVALAGSTAVAPRIRKEDLITEEELAKIGANTLGKTGNVSQQLLASAKTSATDKFGETLNQLVATSKKLDPQTIGKPGVIGKLMNFGKSVKEMALAEYNSVDTQAKRLVDELDKMADQMAARVVLLDQMHTETQATYTALGYEITQSEMRLAALQQYLAEAPAPTNGLEAQELADLQDRANRLDKEIFDLRQGQQLALLAMPEIRLEQSNKRGLVTVVKTIKRTTLPAFLGVFSRYILSLETKQGVELVNAVQQATDAAFRMQADQLRSNTVAVATAQQQSVVTMETLTHMQEQLFGALDDAARIAKEGAEARAKAKPELEKLSQGLIARFSPTTKT